jgi:cytoskeleton protein RodZ
MESLGIKLRETREKSNITLLQAAESTRISLKFLKSLEEEKYEELPGGMYNRAFLRCYSEYLHLDPNEMLRHYESRFSPQSAKPIKAKIPLPGTTSFKIHSLALWSVMLLLSVACLFISRHWISAAFSPYFSHPEPIPLIQNEVSQPLPSATGLDQSQAAVQQTIEAIQAAPAEVGPPGPDAVGGLRLEFEVSRECWVSVRSDGKQVASQVLRPGGSSQSFMASESFYLILGNAGGVCVKINGERLKPLGKMGEVVRVMINEQNIKDLLAKSSDG